MQLLTASLRHEARSNASNHPPLPKQICQMGDRSSICSHPPCRPVRASSSAVHGAICQARAKAQQKPRQPPRPRPVRHAHRRVAARHGCMRANQHCVGDFWSDHVVSRPLTGLLMQLTPCNLQMMLGRCSTGGINRVCLVGRQPANADCVRLLLGMHCCLSLSADGCQWLFGLVPRQVGS